MTQQHMKPTKVAVVVQQQHTPSPRGGGGANPTPPLRLQPISHADAKDFLARYHYLGTKPFRCRVAFGLLARAELIGAAVYHGLSVPETAVGAFGLRRDEQDWLWELGRLALKAGYNGGVLGSYLIRRSIMLLKRQRPVRAVIAYADSSRHLGAIYQAAGFTYCGLTAPRKDFYVNGRIQQRGTTKGVCGRWRLRPRKHRYIVVVDKTLHLRWPVLPYPKRKDGS